MAGDRAVIINADDFGFSPGVTEGIVRAHTAGVVSSTTIMANMPAAAAAVARLAEVPDLGVGVHLNASQGRPLSEAGRVLADDDGVMRRTATGLILSCCRRPSLVEAVEEEFAAQIRWVLDHGIQPTHLDSHRHAHGFPPIFKRVLRLARRYTIQFVRRHRECLPGPGWPAAPARQQFTSGVLNLLGAINRRSAGGTMPTLGTWGIAHTGAIDAAWLVRAAWRMGRGVTEIMVHVGYPDEPGSVTAGTRLAASRESELQAVCDPAVREALRRSGVRLVHYGQL